MNALTEHRSGALAAPEKNAFEQYGEEMQSNRIVGDLLKFSKGEYLAGQNGDEVEEGTELVANMHELMVGWVRWEDNKPTDMRMGRIAEGFKPVARRELGDTDESEWEIDESSGKPRDPWQPTNYLILKDAESDKLYTFATSSKGGLGAIANLCREYGKAMRQKPDQLPVIALGTDSYRHPNKAYGKIFTPKLEIVGWAPRDAFDEALAADRERKEEPEIPFEEPAPKKGGGKAKPAAVSETAF